MLAAAAEYLLYPVYKLLALVWYWPMVVYGACGRKRVCTTAEVSNVLLQPAHRLAQLIVDQEVTCRHVIEAYIGRMKEVNPSINAIVEERFHAALLEAAAIDERVTSASSKQSRAILLEQYPLLGVPLTVKESVSVEGMSNAAGCYNAMGRRATRDADIVRKCRESGAIILAVSNTPELCLNWETYNNVTGTTRNPYDTRRTAGGSSGGEAALLGSGASVIGLGSDIAGSLRLPAHYCGVFSHKPTANVVSTKGHYPDCSHVEKWNKHFVLGPMTRYATDLLPLMKILVKDDFRESLDLNRRVSMEKVKVYYLKQFPSVLCSRLDAEIYSRFDFLLDHLKIKYDCNVQPLKKNFFGHSIIPMTNVLLEIKGVDDHFYKKPKRNLLMDLLSVIFTCSKTSFTSVLYRIMARYGQGMSESTIIRSNQKIETLRNDLEGLLQDDGVLIMPTFHRTANYHYTTLPKCLDTMTTMVFNVLGLPVTHCPIGYHSNGLPFGVQVVSKQFNDRLSIGVAEEIERICGGWKLPQTQ